MYDEETSDEVFRAAEDNDLERLRTLIESRGVSPRISRGRNRKTLAHVAAEKGNLVILKYLLDRDPSILTYDLSREYLETYSHLSIFETAVEYGHLDIVRYLLENHNVDDISRIRSYKDDFFYGDHYVSPVGLAILKGHLNITKYFIEERRMNVDPGLPDTRRSYHYRSDPLLFIAYKSKHPNITNYLIEERKANLSILNFNSQNILYPAVYNNDLNFIKYILDEKKANIDINWRDKDGKTLLYKAAERPYQDVHIVRYLVEQKKADVSIPENWKSRTPLHEAAWYTEYEILKFLVDHGSDLKKKDKDGVTPLHMAVKKNFLWKDDDDKKCLYLLQHGANVTEKNNEGETPIDIILKTEKTKASKYLIDYMDDVDARNDEGETLVHKAATLNKIEILDYLVNKKHAKVDVARKKDKWTPLHCAAYQGNMTVCKYLVEHGANPLAKDKEGKNPAQVARKKEVVNFIQNASPKLRNRRSISPSTWVSAPQVQSHERMLDQVSGHLNGRATVTSIDETKRSNHFHSFLLLTNFFARYLFLSSARTPTDEYNSLGTAEDYQNRMDHIAEEAVRNFVDI